MKVEWLYRGLMTGPCLTLVLSEAEFQKAMGHCDIAPSDRGNWIKTDHANATTHYLVNKDGNLACIVALRVEEGITPIQVAGMLVHEAVHVFQQFCERIGEDQPSAEFEAYSIQSISQRLMQAYADRMETA